jgi:L-cysteine desulfidase
MNAQTYEEYIKILEFELIPACGCTEPIAVAYASAMARKVLGFEPDRIEAECSGNLIKNVKGVIVPSTGDMRGIPASAILGAIAGDAEKKLEVLSGVTEKDVEKTRKLVKEGLCKVSLLQGISNLQLIIKEYHGKDEALVEICGTHTNIVRIEKNGETLLKADYKAGASNEPDKTLLNLKDIYEFAQTVEISDVKAVLERQIKCNLSIAEEGLKHSCGANVGKTMLKHFGSDVDVKAAAYAAAGSDARMSGCNMPVVINSGSGNQGLTVSMPVYVHAKALGVSDEKLYRALAFSNLVAMLQKSKLGRLSAYCGAVSAACGSGAAIAYLQGATYKQIEDTITNTIANVSGIVCDGAKASCAAKIASSVNAATMGRYMAMDNNVFKAGEGLVMDSVEKTIDKYTTMGREGMKETDETILNMMIE